MMNHWRCAVLVALVATLAIPSGRAAAQSALSRQKPAILVFGDSLSAAYGMRAEEGWVSLLEKKLTKEGYGYRVTNASVSGETTAGGRARLKRTLDLHRPAIVVLELGANDGLRGLPVEGMRTNLEAMIGMAQNSGARVLLVGMRIPVNYGPAYTGQFQSAFKGLAEKFHLPFVPFLLESVALNEQLTQADGIHPNPAAQPKLLETVWPALKPLLQRP